MITRMKRTLDDKGEYIYINTTVFAQTATFIFAWRTYSQAYTCRTVISPNAVMQSAHSNLPSVKLLS